MERKSLFERKQSNGGGNARPETFAFTVEGYDLEATPHAVIGRRIDNGEQVRVTLRDIKQVGDSEHGRPEIAEYAQERTTPLHPGTAIGGTLIAQDAFRNDDSFAARWLKVASHAPGEAFTFVADATVFPLRVTKAVDGGRNVTKYSTAVQFLHSGDFPELPDEVKDILKITPAFNVTDVAELSEATSALLSDDLGVALRVRNEDAFDASVVRFDRKAYREAATEEERAKLADGAAQNFLRSIAALHESIDNNEVTAEVVPYSTVWAGPKFAQTLTKGVMKARADKYLSVVDRGPERPAQVTQLFRPTLVTVRYAKAAAGQQPGLFVSHFEPLYNKPAMRGVSEAAAFAQTANFAPPVPAPVAATQREAGASQEAPAPAPAAAAAAPRAAAPAPAPAASDFADSQPPMTDDDLMFDAGFEEPMDTFDAPVAAPAAPAANEAPARRYAGRRA